MQEFLYDPDHFKVLAVYDDLLIVVQALNDKFLKKVPFAGAILLVIFRTAVHLCRMVAYLLEQVEQGEDVHIRYRLFVLLEDIDQTFSP